MIAVDTNVLVYAHRLDSPFHERARRAVDDLRRRPAAWAIPWPCLHEFVAVVTHPRIFRTPTPLDTAFAAIDAWMAGDNVVLLAESDGYLAKLRDLATGSLVSGARIHDARIAALCLHHGVGELWTADRDFSLFPELTTRNPVAAV